MSERMRERGQALEAILGPKQWERQLWDQTTSDVGVTTHRAMDDFRAMEAACSNLTTCIGQDRPQRVDSQLRPHGALVDERGPNARRQDRVVHCYQAGLG